MLSPSYLEHCADDTVNVTAAYSESVIRDTARRLAEMERVHGYQEWQRQVVLKSGYLRDDVMARIEETSSHINKYVDGALRDSNAQNIKYESDILKRFGKSRRMAPGMERVLNGTINGVTKDVSNLTMTTAISTSNNFINVSNEAYMQIATGAQSYSQAIRDAIKNMAQQGLTVYYPSGHTDKIDVAVRRNVLSAVNKSSGDTTLLYASENNCDYVETTAHSGARLEHEIWQGTVCCISGRDPRYPDFVKYTRYGSGEGLCGWNCRHNFYMFFPGLSVKAYTKKMLDEYAKSKYFWSGNQLTDYECSQKQRTYERKIREKKRLLAAYDSIIQSGKDDELTKLVEMDFVNESVQLKAFEKNLRDFCQQTDRHVDFGRMKVFAVRDPDGRIVGFNKSVSQKAVRANKRKER